MKRLIIAAGLLLTLALPAGVAAAPPGWNLTGTYTISFTCTSGCGDTYIHSMTITASDDITGAVTGTGSVQGFPGYDWTVTGTVSGSDVTLDIEWTSPGGMEIYNPLMLTGSIDSLGAMSGTAVDAQARTFTWTTTEGNATQIQPSQSPVVTASPSAQIQPSQSPVVTASLSATLEGATATTSVTPPPTSTASGSAGISAPLMVLLICLAFCAVGLSAVAMQRRGIRG